MAYMTTKEIERAATFLGNQVKAGIPIQQIVKRMVKLQPRHAETWEKCAESISQGGYLSEGLKDALPSTVVQAISAGEMSGKLEPVLERVEKTMQLQQQIQKTVMKLSYPVGLILGGFAVFVFFMVKVMPNLQASLGSMVSDKGSDPSPVFQLSNWMVYQFEEYGALIAISVVVVVFLVMFALKQPENRRAIINVCMNIPILGKALTYLYFGLWAHYVALLDASGSFSAKDKFLAPVQTLPPTLASSVELFADDIERRGLAEASDPEMQEEGDPRRKWPFYISSALMVAHETGSVDVEFERVAPALLKEGFMLIDKSVQVANFFALAVAGALIVTPLGAYYWQMGQVFKQAMQS